MLVRWFKPSSTSSIRSLRLPPQSFIVFFTHLAYDSTVRYGLMINSSQFATLPWCFQHTYKWFSLLSQLSCRTFEYRVARSKWKQGFFFFTKVHVVYLSQISSPSFLPLWSSEKTLNIMLIFSWGWILDNTKFTTSVQIIHLDGKCIRKSSWILRWWISIILTEKNLFPHWKFSNIHEIIKI